jgi:hypothetical protein
MFQAAGQRGGSGRAAGRRRVAGGVADVGDGPVWGAGVTDKWARRTWAFRRANWWAEQA